MNDASACEAPWRLRQVSHRQLWWTLGLSILVWGLALCGSAWWLHTHGVGIAEVRQQRLILGLPDLMHASADLNSIIHTRMDTDLTLRVPIDQTLIVELPKQVQGQSQLNALVPVDTEISHQFVMDIRTQIDTQVSVAAWLPDVSVKFPLTLSVPVAMRIPVKTQVPLSLNFQAQARLPATVQVPIKTAMNIRLPIHLPLQIQATSRAHFALHAADRGMPLELTYARLSMPLSALQLVPLPELPHPAGQGQQGQQQHP